jgi:hypothetical protein
MQVIRWFSSALAVGLFILGVTMPARGEVITAKGKATVRYVGKAVTPEDKAKAVSAAQIKAVETYFAQGGDAEAANFDAMRQKIVENPDRYILESTVLAEEDIASALTYSVSVKVSLNGSNLRNDMKAGSAVGKATKGDRSALAFVSRELDSDKTSATREFRRVDVGQTAEGTTTSATQGSERESIKKGQVSTSDSRTDSVSAKAKASLTVETGGSQTRRANDRTWRLFPSSNLNQVFTKAFSGAGFKVKEGAMVEPASGGLFKVSMVENDYKTGNDLKSSTMVAIANGMKTARIPYVAIGTLDVGLSDEDGATGLRRVAVTVNASVYDMTEDIPDTIASVGPVVYAGIGPTEDEARINALKLAANNASRELVSQLNSLGLK